MSKKIEVKKIKINRLQELENSISLASTFGVDEEEHGFYIVEVLNEDGSVNEHLSMIANELCDVNRRRREIINTLMEA